MALSFTADIRPLFRDSSNVGSMQGYGLDLSSYEDVKARAAEIYARIADGSRLCDEAWPPRAPSVVQAVDVGRDGAVRGEGRRSNWKAWKPSC